MTAERVVVWAPGRDGELTCGFLAEHEFSCHLVHGWDEARDAVRAGCGCLLLGGEMLTPDVALDLEDLLVTQPPWSDLPVLVVGAREDDDQTLARALHAMGNVSLLPRPVAVSTLVTSVVAALRARRRQYQVRDLLAQRDEADRRKDEFLAMLAHELRNPLAPLRTGLQVLRLAPAPDVVERMHHLMERQLGHVTRLVDDLLDVSRLTRGAVALKTRVLDLRDAVHQACESVAGAIGEKGLTLHREVPETPLLVEADPVRLEQMIGNLLTNAMRFTPAGGRLTVVTARDGEPTAVVRVADTGEGIPADQIGRVFDLFAQTDRPIDRSQGGLGIGLTVVRSLAELHGGSTSISSPGPGQGTEAVITLPLATRDAGTAQAPTDDTLPEMPSLRVVVIEDNPDAADALAVFLQRLGHDVAIARDGRAGLEAVARHRPQVVICDIGLPEVDGYEVARRLLASDDTPPCLLIAVTGYGDVVDRARTRAAGFAYHLTKPADPAELVRLLADVDRVRCA